jgi:hypothetical protein
MTITMKDLKTIKADLVRRRKARLTVTDDRDLSTKETILRLAPELRRVKKRGFTTTEMIEALKENGLNIKGATLNRYLAESQPPKAGSGDGRRKNQEAASQSDQRSDGTNAKGSEPKGGNNCI